jgi:undecaprenyl-diphosphatase
MISQIVATIAGADQYIFHLTNGGYTTPLLDRVMTFLSWSGNLGVIWLALLGAVALLGKKTGRRIALVGLGALAIGFFASEIIKEITMRPRPFLSLDEARLLISAPSSYAFPSGHTTSSFAVASGLLLGTWRLLGRVPFWAWGSLALAAAISYSRLYVGVHWPTDVLSGIALGVASGWVASRPCVARFVGGLFRRFHKRLHSRSRSTKSTNRRGGREILVDGANEDEREAVPGLKETGERLPRPLEVGKR